MHVRFNCLWFDTSLCFCCSVFSSSLSGCVCVVHPLLCVCSDPWWLIRGAHALFCYHQSQAHPLSRGAADEIHQNGHWPSVHHTDSSEVWPKQPLVFTGGNSNIWRPSGRQTLVLPCRTGTCVSNCLFFRVEAKQIQSCFTLVWSHRAGRDLWYISLVHAPHRLRPLLSPSSPKFFLRRGSISPRLRTSVIASQCFDVYILSMMEMPKFKLESADLHKKSR